MERLGLIGPNGSGKTTLLRILTGAEKADSGEISRRGDLPVSAIAQEDDLEPAATIESILTNAIAADSLEPYERAALLNKTVSMVGFPDVTATVSTLSGGWRKRLSIALALIQRPDLLLMDEPTNHLDLQGILWLEDLLNNASFAFVVISHDRYFLENVTNRIVEMNRAYPDGYLAFEGNFSNFLVRKDAFLQAQANLQQDLEGKVKREVDWLRRGPQARTTKAQYRIDAAYQLIDQLSDVKNRNSQDRSVTLDFTSSQRKTKELLKARGVAKAMGSHRLFTSLDIDLMPGTKLGILGPNGSGKSTLIRLLTGELEADAGAITRAVGLRIVYFDQHRTPLEPGVSLRRALAPESDNVLFRGDTMHVTSWARRFLFQPEQLDMPVGALSGGEQARILMANLMREPADLLILDEPTNDLDIPSLEVLEDTLIEFTGALILVTHDRFMLDSVSTELLALGGKGGAGYFADYAQWERTYRASLDAEKAPAGTKAAAQRPSTSGRKLSTAEQRELAQMEDSITAAEQAVLDCQERLTDPGVVSDHVKMDAAWKDLQSAQERAAGLYIRWEELESRR